jgi:steroid delta-isomerase-like uncharacterized protein
MKKSPRSFLFAPRWSSLGIALGVLLSITPLASAGDSQTAGLASPDDATRNKALVRRWIDEGFNARRLAVADEIFAERLAVNGNAVGREGLKQSMSRHLAAFPDLRVVVDDMVAEGSKVGLWYTVEGTHRGEFEGVPPTGKRVKWSGVDLFILENGRVSEVRFLSDLIGLLRQLGATVSAPADGATR